MAREAEEEIILPPAALRVHLRHVDGICATWMVPRRTSQAHVASMCGARACSRDSPRSSRTVCHHGKNSSNVSVSEPSRSSRRSASRTCDTWTARGAESSRRRSRRPHLAAREGDAEVAAQELQLGD